MPDLFSSVELRDDIASGSLPTSQFAANLQDVIEGRGPDAYRNPESFFSGSHPSSGMTRLLNEALGRVSGAKTNSQSLVRLETSLGGGKTHSLIALYHAARCQIPGKYVAEFMEPANLPKTPIDRIAVFVGDDSGAVSFPSRDGVTPKTLWGHIALQLGGKNAYEHVRPDDESLTAPGAATMEAVLGDEPAIIMLDEIARYLTVAAGIATGANTLADQTVAFIMALVRAVEAKSKAILVVTTTETTDVFGDQVERLLKGFRDILARKEYVIPPAVESDLSAILARRLFKTISQSGAQETAREYAEAISAATQAGTSFPEAMTQATWAQNVERSYPFHPSLIMVLDKRISTMPNFQRTRGALRLLALAARDLWKSKPSDTKLIHIHHLNLKNQEIVEEVTGHIARPKFKQVIETDIASAPGALRSHAEEIDNARGGNYARNLATSVYYWSLTKDIPGVPENALLGSVIAPSDDVVKYVRALEDLTSSTERGAWYLTVDPRGGYRFGTEASPNRVLQEFKDAIKPTEVTAKCTDILEDLFRDSSLKVKRHWQGQSVPDSFKDVFLVIFHWDDFGGDRGADPAGPTPEKMNEIWEKTPSGGIRQYRNRLVFLAPDRNQHQSMVDAVRKHMALSALVQSTENMSRFSSEKQSELQQLEQQSELEARVAVAAHMSLLYVPQKAGLQMSAMTTPNKADIKKNQTDLVLEELKKLDKVVVAGSGSYAPLLLKTKLGAFFSAQQSTEALEERIASNADFKILMDGSALVTAIRNGISNGDWEYNDPSLGERGWATKLRPSGTTIQISPSTFLNPVGSAPIPKAAECPLCGRAHDPGACPSVTGGGGPTGGPRPPAPPHLTFEGRGAAGATTNKVIADARDANRLIKSIEYAVDELDKAVTWEQLSKLLSVIHVSTKGVSQRYRIEATIDLKEQGDRATITFEGSREDVERIKEPLRALLTKQDNRSAILRANLYATFASPESPDSALIATVLEGATSRGPANCTVTINTEEQAA